MVSTVIDGVAQLILCMILHECGHLFMARVHGVEVKKIGVRRMGMYVLRARTTGWREVSICLAGVAVNSVLAVTFWHIDHWFALCNFTFAWVNLLPIPNSDGRHALEAWRAKDQI